MPEVSRNRTSGRTQRPYGFTLLELALVVAVILIIAAVAVPSMMRARMKANEASAVASLRAINAAETVYATAYPDVGFSGNLADLGAHGSNCERAGKTNSCLIMDGLLASGAKSGYRFDLMGDGQVPDRTYTVTVAPVSIGFSGRCTFASDQMGAIRIVDPATTTSRFSETATAGCSASWG